MHCMQRTARPALAWLLAALALLLGACSHQPLQRVQLTASQTLLDVPFVAQREHYCGPASLSMLLQQRGLAQTQQRIAEAIYLPGRKGTLQAEIAAYIRAQGLLAYQIPPHLQALLDEIATGNPVLVLQNLGFVRWPRWHYAVAIGYDLDRQQLILHSGQHARYRLDLRTFVRTWQRAGHWGLVALPSQQPALSPSADADSLLAAIIELETHSGQRVPISTYQRIAQHAPTNSLAWFSLGNRLYSLASPASRLSALGHFLRAAELEPNPGYYNNLAWVASELGCAALAASALQCGLAQEPGNRFLRDTQNNPPTPLALDKPVPCPSLHCPAAIPATAADSDQVR
ncbi:MAG: hypothetical protein CSA54_00730 [Gammaproteobacteria bacterium]|nr:MAG: hypothetical protein CSA54_00730 [Gammaproteobacteria bacterium]